MGLESGRTPRTPRIVGMVAGGLLAFLLGGPVGFLVFLSIALIAAVFTIRF